MVCHRGAWKAEQRIAVPRPRGVVEEAALRRHYVGAFEREVDGVATHRMSEGAAFREVQHEVGFRRLGRPRTRESRALIRHPSAAAHADRQILESAKPPFSAMRGNGLVEQ